MSRVRPGGLLVLALLNLLLAAIYGLLAISCVITVIQHGYPPDTESIALKAQEASKLFDPSDRTPLEDFREAARKARKSYIFGTIYYPSAVLLLVAGAVGMFMMWPMMGRWLTTAYCLADFAATATAVWGLDLPFQFSTLVGLVYPVMLLILINTVFAEDFS